jgi:putative exosortase-associated protein (TIGR04073 family)
MISGQLDSSRIEVGGTRRALRCWMGLATALLAISLLVPNAALAQTEYTPARKVGRGFVNVGLGVLAIPGQMVKETEDRGPAIGLPYGFVKGIGWFLATELVGVWEILTCPFEFPKGFRPILEPEFPWDYFREGR